MGAQHAGAQCGFGEWSGAGVAEFGTAWAYRGLRDESGMGLCFGRWDAGWYIGIAESGYSYWGNLSRQSNVAFFPAYPLAMRATAALLGARWGSPESVEDSFRTFTERRHVRLLHAGWLLSVAPGGGRDCWVRRATASAGRPGNRHFRPKV